MRFCLVLLGLSMAVSNILAGEDALRIAAASSLKGVMDECVTEFKKKHPATHVEVIYASSGKLFHQISNGAPYDIYFPADQVYLQKLSESGRGVAPPVLFAKGRLAAWSAAYDMSDVGAKFFLSDKVKKIAVANPKLAPYGVAAVAYLEKLGVYEAVKSKLVYGENVSQVLHFAISGAADVVITSYSLLARDKKKAIQVHLPEVELYPALEQGFIGVKGAANVENAAIFGKFLLSPGILALWEKYGYLQTSAE